MQSQVTQQYLRISDIVRNRNSGQPGVLSISTSTWWDWVKKGKAPQSIKLSGGVTVWRRDDVLAFAESLAAGGAR